MNQGLIACIHWIFVINEQSKKYASNRKSGGRCLVFKEITFLFQVIRHIKSWDDTELMLC